MNYATEEMQEERQLPPFHMYTEVRRPVCRICVHSIINEPVIYAL
jgi:hypothetical protein